MDFTDYKNKRKQQYIIQLDRLRNEKKETDHIEKTVIKAMNNIETGVRSFVICGEPQCGKTEMMICLTAKLTDHGFRTILVLVNDNVELLYQNYDRFVSSKITPTPMTLQELLEVQMANRPSIIFCKKNNPDLKKLISQLQNATNQLVILDDEADFSSPNGKVNMHDNQSAINQSIEELLHPNGIYIGVTATPGRLDLNDTFSNKIDNWVYFQPHSNYIGKDIFFPGKGVPLSYSLRFLEDGNNEEENLKEALFNYLVNVALVNNENRILGRKEANYCFLIHTSGKKSDHKDTSLLIQNTLNILSDSDDDDFLDIATILYNTALKKVDDPESAEVVIEHILNNIGSKVVKIVNSDRVKVPFDLSNPPALFTILIGGNMVSRGVTVGNLLSMYFSRSVKKMQQDTYIQRARMFGNRKDYLAFFELWIPEKLYRDWERCFVYHDFAIGFIKNNLGAPVWMGDEDLRPVAPSSVRKQIINVKSGEITFELFDWDDSLKQLDHRVTPQTLQSLDTLYEKTSEKSFPRHILQFIKKYSTINENVIIHEYEVRKASSHHRTLYRPKGIIGGKQKNLDIYPLAEHLVWLVHNDLGFGRIAYKYLPRLIKYYEKMI